MTFLLSLCLASNLGTLHLNIEQTTQNHFTREQKRYWLRIERPRVCVQVYKCTAAVPLILNICTAEINPSSDGLDNRRWLFQPDRTVKNSISWVHNKNNTKRQIKDLEIIEKARLFSYIMMSSICLLVNLLMPYCAEEKFKGYRTTLPHVDWNLFDKLFCYSFISLLSFIQS